MDYLEAIEALDRMIRSAKGVPLSASAVIPREEALALVQTLRESLPGEHERAKEIIAEREQMVAGAREEAAAIVERAQTERARLVGRTEVVQQAKAEAERLVAEADAAASKLKVQADDYVDTKLGGFEAMLNKTVRSVQRGREQLRRRLDAAREELGPLALDDSGEISGEIPLTPPES